MRPGIATPEATLDGLGKEFRIDRSGMKPYACCRGLHACIDALLQIMAETNADSRRHPPHDRAWQRADSAASSTAPALRTCSMRSSACSTRLAVTAMSGRATLDQFQPQRTAEPEISRLMARHRRCSPIGCVKAGDYPPLEVELADGRRIERARAIRQGRAAKPAERCRARRQRCSRLIDPVLGAPRRREIVATVADLDELADVQVLTRLLVRGGQSKAA